MARRVYLHIGTMKSATSYIQDLCNANVEKLAAQGIHWGWSQDNFLAADDLLGTTRERPGLEGAWERLARQIRDHPADALVSNELLATIGSSKVRRLVEAFGPAEVHVVLTARDLARTIPSQWQTGVRNRHLDSWDDYVAALVSDSDAGGTAASFWRRHDLARIITRWQRHVPEDRISLVTVPRAGADPAIMGERFAAVIGADAAGLQQPAQVNASLGTHSAELLRRINERTEDLDWLHYMWAFKNALSRLVLARRASQEPPIRLDGATLAWCVQRAHSLVESVEATGVRVVGDLSELIPSGEPTQHRVDPAHSTDAELLDAALAGLVGVGQVLADLRIEHEQLVDDVEGWLTPTGRERLRAEQLSSYLAPGDDLASRQLEKSRVVRRLLAEPGYLAGSLDPS